MSPPELNDLYDELWKVATLLEGPDALDILEDAYRPWGRPDCVRNVEWYVKHDNRLPERKAMLREFRSRSDAAEYSLKLREVFALFGNGIKESLTRTMGDYLEATNGKHARSKLAPEVIEKASVLFNHNNNAERPFAVMKAFQKQYPSMKVSMLGAMTHARMSGVFKDGGAFTASEPRLQHSISDLCCIHAKKPGKITTLLRECKSNDLKLTAANRKKRTHKKYADQHKALATRAKRKNLHFETPIDYTVAKLRLQLEGLNKTDRGARGRCIKHLKNQVNVRLTAGRDYELATTPEIGMAYRGKRKPYQIKMAPSNGEDELEHLTKLVELMIAEDAKHEYEAPSTEVTIRCPHVISADHTNPISVQFKLELQKEQQELAQPKDDPLLLSLLETYVGKFMLDAIKIRGRRGFEEVTYAIVNVQHDTKRGGDYYEATCAKAELSSDGKWEIAPDQYLRSGEEKILDPSLLEGYYLVDLADPVNPVHFQDVAECIQAHEARCLTLTASASTSTSTAPVTPAPAPAAITITTTRPCKRTGNN